MSGGCFQSGRLLVHLFQCHHNLTIHNITRRVKYLLQQHQTIIRYAFNPTVVQAHVVANPDRESLSGGVLDHRHTILTHAEDGNQLKLTEIILLQGFPRTGRQLGLAGHQDLTGALRSHGQIGSEGVAQCFKVNIRTLGQAPPGIKITRRAFGRDRRYPLTSGF